MGEKQLQGSVEAASPREVDRIRDIIFGAQMRDYDQRFEALAQDVARLQRELNQLGEQLAAQATAQNKSLQNLRSDLRQADSDLRNELKAELERLAGQVADNDSSQAQNLQTVRQELRNADNELREELRRIAQRLTDAKVDRSQLGELFIELGNHVKGGGTLADMLKSLEQQAA